MKSQSKNNKQSAGAQVVEGLIWPLALAGWAFSPVLRAILNTFDYIGRFFLLIVNTLWYVVTLRIPVALTIQQMAHLGTDSILIVVFCIGFTGMILAWILADQALDLGFGLEYVGGAVVYAMAKDLTPVLACMVLSGRVGAGIASEIGTMKVTEQIDALRALAVPPIRHLVVPRFLACGIMIPLVCYVAGFVGVWAGWLPLHFNATTHLNARIYFDSVFAVLDYKLLWIAYKKSLYFGIIIAFISCLEGFATRGGARGVGVTVTRAVVISMVCIFIADLILTL